MLKIFGVLDSLGNHLELPLQLVLQLPDFNKPSVSKLKVEAPYILERTRQGAKEEALCEEKAAGPRPPTGSGESPRKGEEACFCKNAQVAAKKPTLPQKALMRLHFNPNCCHLALV